MAFRASSLIYDQAQRALKSNDVAPDGVDIAYSSLSGHLAHAAMQSGGLKALSKGVRRGRAAT